MKQRRLSSAASLSAGLVFVRGRVVSAARARVSAMDRGFLYGDAVFEVLRVYASAPFRWATHWTRLQRGAAHAHIPLPAEAALQRGVARLLASAPGAEASLRIVVTRGEALGLAAEREAPPTWLLYLLPIVRPGAALYRRGARVLLVDGEDAPSAPSALKSSNYLWNVLATRRARAEGAHEALRLRRGKLEEGASSNVFVAHDGVLSTPPLGAGVLDGVTRGFILELCAARGVRVRERPIRRAALLAADEVFLSSSIREILPVTEIQEGSERWRVGEGRPGPLARALMREYGTRARRECRAWLAKPHAARGHIDVEDA